MKPTMIFTVWRQFIIKHYQYVHIFEIILQKITSTFIRTINQLEIVFFQLPAVVMMVLDAKNVQQ